jgi:hypothetical protein
MRRFCICLLLVVAQFPGRAFAQAESDIERAKQSFRAGATAYAAGDYLAAIQALDAAYQLTPLPAIAFSLGQAERRQYFVDHSTAHLARAISLFRHYIDVAPAGSRRADALEALSQLEPLAALQASPKSATPPPPAEARPTRVLITSEAPGARLALDGGAAVPSPLIREVEPGKHRVQIRAPGFFSSTREVTAVPGELILNQVTLRERPSVLSISTAEDAEIYVDGAFLSHGGEAVVAELPSGKHQIAVAQKGYRVSVEEVRLERGKAQSIRIGLEPTAQRIAAEAQFIAGGAALGASLVFSALTIRAEGRAEDFLGARAHGNVLSSDLVRYNSALIDRDRYRLATTVCLASAAGFFITGLFLHELDQPNPQLLYRTTVRSGSDSSPKAPEPAKPRVRVAPIAFAGGFGAMLGGAW